MDPEYHRLASLLVNLMQTVQEVENKLRLLGMTEQGIAAHEAYGRERDRPNGARSPHRSEAGSEAPGNGAL